MEADSEHVKTVYAEFGLAIYLAQVLEHGLANAMVFAELLPYRAGNPVSRKQLESEFDAFLGGQFEKTLGRMIGNLKRITDIPPNLEKLLAESLKKRNFLSHHYFRERAEAFISKNGREQMIKELRDAQGLFENTDDLLTQIAKPLREKYGLSDEKLTPYIDEYMAKLFEK